MDLAPDLLIPKIPAAELALIEKHLDAGRTQCLANLLSGLRVLRGVAQKYRVRGLCNDGTTPQLMRRRSSQGLRRRQLSLFSWGRLKPLVLWRAQGLLFQSRVTASEHPQ